MPRLNAYDDDQKWQYFKTRQQQVIIFAAVKVIRHTKMNTTIKSRFCKDNKDRIITGQNLPGQLLMRMRDIEGNNSNHR